MASYKVNQSDNKVGGDQAGRDINKKITNIIESRSSKITPMSKLIEKFKYEYENNIQFRQTVEKLEHFSQQADDGEVVGLEAKLEDGNQLDLLKFAQKTKEIFAKKLAKYQFYESAQKIHASLLAEVYSRFYRNVYPAIQQKLPQEVIQDLIQQKVIEPVQELLEENILELYADEINGMLYFLTGNCHIKWRE